MITVQTVQDCIARAADVARHLKWRYPSVVAEVHRMVIVPLQAALAHRQIHEDAWNTLMLRLRYYEDLYARTR